MIDINFGKESRLDLINFFIKKTNCQSYLEIGCDRNQIFNKINIKNKVGVDPVRGGNVRATSDDFFQTNTQTFDVIFIDGLHYYEQVKKDVINSLNVLNNNGAIILHDMLPITQEQAIVPIPENAGVWLGDVWRLAFDLSNSPDINFNLIKIDYGCGLIYKNKSKILNELNIENSWEYYKNNYNKLPLQEFSYIRNL